MTREKLARLALAGACAAAVAAPLAVRAQMAPGYPQPMMPSYPQRLPGPPPGMPERVMTYNAAPVVSPGDEPGGWDARQNVRESRQYEALVQSNPSFRARRMAQECGSIADPQGQEQCLSTFDYGDSER
jgi:hypothetical protein